MDIANATAAGPSRGLLDVLFGSKPEEGADADGQGFMPLMDLIKALNKENQDGEAGDRTEKEIAPGKGAVDYSAVGMPGVIPALLAAQQKAAPQEGTSQTAEKQAVQRKVAEILRPLRLMQKTALQGAPGGVDAELVNRMLQEKSLPPLSPQEAKLLEEVNGKLAQMAGQGPDAVADGSADPDSKAASEKKPGEAAFLKELAQKGIDPKQLRGQEGSAAGAAPDKFLSTEAYMHMHDRFGKEQPKTDDEPKRFGGTEGAAPVRGANADLSKQIAEAGRKSKDLFGRPEGDLPGLGKGEKGEQKALTAPFAGLLQATQGQMETKDVMLTSTKPAEIRGRLLGEVNQAVGFQALKGGGEMRLVIHPEALGEVKLKIGSSGGKVEVQVTAENENVAKIIRGGSKELENSLKDHNLSLAKFDVHVSPEAPLVATDTKTSLSDQFMPPQQHNHPQGGFAQAGNESNGRFNQWGGGQQHHRRSSSEFMAEDNHRSMAPRPGSRAKPRDNSRRLDVVA